MANDRTFGEKEAHTSMTNAEKLSKYRDVALENLRCCVAPGGEVQYAMLSASLVEEVEGGAWVSCRVWVPEADLEEVEG